MCAIMAVGRIAHMSTVTWLKLRLSKRGLENVVWGLVFGGLAIAFGAWGLFLWETHRSLP